MRTIEWREELSVGINEIDDQHKGFFELINQFYIGMRSGVDLETSLNNLFQKLEKYCLYHFKSEEQLFKKINFPEAAEHTRIHNEFIKEMEWFKARLKDGDVVVAVGVLDQMEKWLISHIADMDSVYAEFMKKKNVKFSDVMDVDESQLVEAGDGDSDPVVERLIAVKHTVADDLSGIKPVAKDGLMGKAASVQKTLSEQVKEIIGIKTFKVYEQFLGTINEILLTVPLTKHMVNKATEMVDFAYRYEERINLISCIGMLRDSEDYLQHHALSVFLIIIEVLVDLKSRRNRIEFYEIFKQVNRNVNFNPQSIKKVALASLFHDHGLSHVDKKILNKLGPLTADEFSIIKQHSRTVVSEFVNIGIKDIEILEVMGNHHAKYLVFDKQGQSVIAQVLNIIDIYDACSSNKGYRAAMPYKQVKHTLSNEMLVSNWERELYGMVMSGTIDNVAIEKSRMMKKLGEI